MSHSYQPIVGCQIHKSQENKFLVHYLLPLGVLECSVYIPPTPGGSDIVQIKIYWPDCLTNGTKLYQSRIDEGTILEESPVVIGYN